MSSKSNVFIITIVTILFASSFIAVRHLKKQHKKVQFTIGILQTASHPALDAVREGFIEELNTLSHNNVEYILKNAQGLMPAAINIATQFHHDKKIDAILAIATPATLAMSSVEKQKPIFIAAVTDPNSLGVIYPNTNVSGASDIIDVKSAIEMFAQLLPQVKKVGILFSTGIANVDIVKQIKQELITHGYSPFEFAITNESELPLAAQMAFTKTDAVIAPTDNNVAATMDFINTLSQKYHKPFIASDNLLVKKGALAARGIDYRENGKQAAQIAFVVLLGKQKPFDLPIAQQKNNSIYINEKILQNFGLSIPDALKNDVIIMK